MWVPIFNRLQLFPLKEQSPHFTALPEWIIDDICDFYLFVMRYQTEIFENNPRNAYMSFSMVMLANSEMIKNPYLKSKLVEVQNFNCRYCLVSHGNIDLPRVVWKLH